MSRLEDDLRDPGVESLIFRPAKVSWAINAYLFENRRGWESGYIAFILFLVVLFSAWATVSEKAIVVDTAGEIVTKSPPIPVLTKTSFVVRKIYVADNQRVEKNQMIVDSISNLSAGDAAKIQNYVSDLSRKIATEKASVCGWDCYSALQSLSETQFSGLPKIEIESELHRGLQDIARSTRDYLAQLKALRETPSMTRNITSEIGTIRRKMEEIQRRRAQKVLAVEYEELRGRLANLESQSKEKSVGAVRSLSTARDGLELLLSRIPQSISRYTADSAILAPASGTLAYLDFKGVGQLVSPGQRLFLVHTSDNELIVKLKLPDTDISKVKPGMEVRLDISSYPASEYGVQYATITAIPEKVGAETQSTDSSFSVYGKLRDPGIKQSGKILPLLAGTSARAKIVIRHEKLIVYILRRLLSIKDDVMGVS